MSEERFDRIEAQISELRELIQANMAVTQQNMGAMEQDVTAVKQDVTAVKQNTNATREDIGSLRQRVDSIEGTVVIAIRDSFNSFRNYLDDLNYDLAEIERKVGDNDRKHRRLNRRVARLERKEEEG
jgi:chromosome segregation ATPase